MLAINLFIYRIHCAVYSCNIELHRVSKADRNLAGFENCLLNIWINVYVINYVSTSLRCALRGSLVVADLYFLNYPSHWRSPDTTNFVSCSYALI